MIGSQHHPEEQLSAQSPKAPQPVPAQSSETPQPPPLQQAGGAGCPFRRETPQLQPQPPQQGQLQPQPPQHYRVHHSYIWLGGIRAIVAVVVAVLLSEASLLFDALIDGDALDVADTSTFLVSALAIAGGIVVLVGLVLLLQWVSYRHLYYELDAEEFSLYSGIFNKKRVHVPYRRIQSVDQRASLLQRIFGVCTVNVDTAGGAANKAVTVPYVQKAQAEELRRELFARKQRQMTLRNNAASDALSPAPTASPADAQVQAQGAAPGLAYPAASIACGNVLDAPAEIWQDMPGVFAGDAVDTGKVVYEYGMSNKELVFTGVSSNTTFWVTILGILGFVGQLVGQAALLLSDSSGLVEDGLVLGVRLFGGYFVVAGIIVFVIAIAVLWLVSVAGTCLSYGGFRVRRRDSRIEVEYGLLQHRFQGVDIDRVQSVVVRQSFIRRLLGYCELSLGKIDAASDGDEQAGVLNRQDLVIHPFVKIDCVSEVLAGLLPEFADMPHENTPVAKVALRRALVRRCILFGSGFWLAVIITVVWAFLNEMLGSSSYPDDVVLLSFVNTGAIVGYALSLVLLVLEVVGAVMWYRDSGFACNRRFMQVSNGGFSRETVSFPRRKIQFGYTMVNPLQRRARTATLNARIAAGVGGTTISLFDVKEEDAAAWLAWVEPWGNVAE